MSYYSLTAYSQGMGWRDIRVNNAADIREAIRVAERATGCRVSHGRGGEQSDFLPGLIVDADTLEVQTVVDPATRQARKAKPVVVAGPPDVMRAIAMALGKPPKAAPKRKTGPGRVQPD